MSTTSSRFVTRTLAALGAAALAAGMLASCASAGASADGNTFEFTLATGAQPGTPNAAVQDWYLDRIEERTGGRITFDRMPVESLCKMTEVVDCLRDGRAHVGVTVPDYTPQYFPTVSMVGIPFINQNAQAVTAALYELHTENEQAVSKLEFNGLHYVSTWPVGRLLLGSPEPVEGVADLAGMRARASGPVLQQVLADAGMNINAITASETYESVERGVIDGVGGSIDFPVGYRLMELLPHWSDPGIGQYSTFGMWFSLDAYEGLPDDLRQIVDDVTAELNAGAAVAAFNESTDVQCAEVLESPSVESLTPWSDEATEEWKAQVGADGEAKWAAIAEGFGLTDAPSFLEEYKTRYAAHADVEYDDATLDCEEAFAGK